MQDEITTKPSINPEKRKEYDDAKRANEKRKREARREEETSGRLEERRLAFLVNIYRSLGYTQQTFAKTCGISPQLLNWYISVTDDCQLSRLEAMLASIGLSVSVTLDGGRKRDIQTEGTGNGVRYRIEGTFAGIRPPSRLPQYIDECTKQNRLHFLRTFIEDRNETAPEFARTCGFDLTSLRYYFVHDDLKLSVLYKIAKATGAEIVWKVNPKEQTKE